MEEKGRCRQCELPQMIVQANKQPLELSDDGLCAYCKDYNANKQIYQINYEKKQLEFERLISERQGKGKYDVAVMFTGGKDSCYSLYLLTQKYKLNVLAVSWDNGFFGKEHRANLENITKKLGIDHLIVSLEESILSEFYRNRFLNFGRFCGCASAALLFLSPTIHESEATIIVTSGSLGQIASRLQNISLFAASPEQKEVATRKSMETIGFTPMKNEQINLMLLLDIVVGRLSDKAVQHFAQCVESVNRLCDKNAMIVNLPCIFEWNLKDIYKEIATIGWKKPSDAAEMGHTSCMMELMKGYISFKQNMLNLDINELSTELRFGNITRAEYEQAFDCLGYSERLPKEFDYWLKTLKLTKDEFLQTIRKGPLAQKQLPPINREAIQRLPIQIPDKEVLEERLESFFRVAILG